MPKWTEEAEVTYSIKLSGEDVETAIRHYFGMPDDADIFFRIPGGGDYSNMELDARAFDKVRASYTRIQQR